MLENPKTKENIIINSIHQQQASDSCRFILVHQFYFNIIGQSMTYDLSAFCVIDIMMHIKVECKLYEIFI